jgi:NADP-dependent 3-hydroxy acid dehydrogenase YdfG
MHALENKIAIVTGAAGSIGAAIARTLAEQGATVVLHYSGSRKRAEDLEQELVRRGAKAICLQADFRQLDQVRRLIGDVVERFGRVDILVNNAGLWDPRPLVDVEESHVASMLQVDFLAPSFASKAALPHFPKEGGRIIHLSSGLARHPAPGSGLLSASKPLVSSPRLPNKPSSRGRRSDVWGRPPTSQTSSRSSPRTRHAGSLARCWTSTAGCIERREWSESWRRLRWVGTAGRD